MGWNYLSIPKLQRLHRWSLGMDKSFHATLYNVCDYLSMLRLKLNHVSKSGPWRCALMIPTTRTVARAAISVAILMMRAKMQWVLELVGIIDTKGKHTESGGARREITCWHQAEDSDAWCQQVISRFAPPDEWVFSFYTVLTHGINNKWCQ